MNELLEALLRFFSLFWSFGFGMSEDTSESWPSENVGPKEHLHALGVISSTYNLFEVALGLLFGELTKQHEVGEFVFRRLNNQGRLEAIKFYFSRADYYSNLFAKQKNYDLSDRVDHLVAYCTICIDNRNILMHSRSSSSTGADLIALEKVSKAKDAASKQAFYNLSLPELRQVADEMMLGFHYILDIERYCNQLRNIERAKETAKLPIIESGPFNDLLGVREAHALLALPPPTLPEKPPLPRSLPEH